MFPILDAKTRTFEEIAAFAESFRRVFPRADQVRWFSIYLWGLVATEGRRSIEAIARSLPPGAIPTGASPAQSLQHFLSRSTWNERQLLAELRKRIGTIGEPGSSWIFHEVVCLKRGKHSVGVHRQFSRDHGMKANSQTAVLISQVGPSGYLPLALRLYLPRGWMDAARPTQLAEIPEADRQPLSKDVIGRRLIAELAADGKRPSAIIGANGFATSAELAGVIREMNLTPVENAKHLEIAETGRQWLKDNLGLDHFEGRSWRGWHHHAASVIAAYGYLSLFP